MQKGKNKTDCSFIRRNLFSYQEKQLPTNVMDEFDDHLRTCEACNRIVNEFLTIESLVNEKRSVEPGPFAGTRILQKIESMMEEQGEKTSHSYKRILRPISLTLIMVMAVIIGFSIVKLTDSKISGSLKHQDNIQAMRSGLNIPDFVDENKTLNNNQ